MFLLRTGESLDIKTDTFNTLTHYYLDMSWLGSKRWSETADGLHSTLFPVECDIPICSIDLRLRRRSVTLRLPHKNLYIMWDGNSLGTTSFKQKREKRWFVDLRIILMSHCGNEFLKEFFRNSWNYFFRNMKFV